MLRKMSNFWLYYISHFVCVKFLLSKLWSCSWQIYNVCISSELMWYGTVILMFVSFVIKEVWKFTLPTIHPGLRSSAKTAKGQPGPSVFVFCVTNLQNKQVHCKYRADICLMGLSMWKTVKINLGEIWTDQMSWCNISWDWIIPRQKFWREKVRWRNNFGHFPLEACWPQSPETPCSGSFLAQTANTLQKS